MSAIPETEQTEPPEPAAQNKETKPKSGLVMIFEAFWSWLIMSRLGQFAKKHHVGLSFGALGVVFGDIGTSPLYVMKECVEKVGNTQANIMGILSMIFWSLLGVVAYKYVTFVMKEDQEGEGGINVLLALLPEHMREQAKGIAPAAVAVMIGAALLYGDGIITPAISILSAYEGLFVVLPKSVEVYKEIIVVALTVVTLLALFAVQKKGTAKLGNVFGAVMAVYFVSIAGLGLKEIFHNSSVIHAVYPSHALNLIKTNPLVAFFLMSSVVLCVTGGEALYADMGHFHGRNPIRNAWYTTVLPALLLNYFGQGALLMREPEAIENPFYRMVSVGWQTYALIALGTAATVIASQALISGAFSLTRQATQLGFCTRVTIIHTSREHEGQIYIPEVNRLLAAACIITVLVTRSSSKLALAYGLAVTGTMAITSFIWYQVQVKTHNKPWWKVAPLLVLFLSIDLMFFSSNVAKVVMSSIVAYTGTDHHFFGHIEMKAETGTYFGFMPIVVATIIALLMFTWKRGRQVLGTKLAESTMPIEQFVEEVKECVHVPGTAVFMSANPKTAPLALLHNFKHNRVVHATTILLSAETVALPRVRSKHKLLLTNLGPGLYKIQVRFGFMEEADIPKALALAVEQGLLSINVNEVSFYLGKETLIINGGEELSPWRKKLFAMMAGWSKPATAYFQLPPSRVVELGMQVEL